LKPDNTIIVTKDGSSSNLPGLSEDYEVVKSADVDWSDVRARVYGGGTQFFSFRKRSSLVYKVKSVIQNPSLIITKIRSGFNRDRQNVCAALFYVGVGVGPFEVPGSLESICDNARKSKCFYVRDRLSYELMKRFNLPQLKFYTDICFAKSYENKILERKRVKKIGVILRDWHDNNENILVDDILGSLGKNFDFEFLVLGKDRKLKRCLDKKKLPYVCYDSNLHGVDGFVDVLNGYDLIISSRYHGLVYSNLLCIPSISLEIEQKLRVESNELLCVGSVRKDNVNELHSIISSINMESEQRRLISALSINRSRAIDMIESFNRLLLAELDQ
jgi:polysaccharide pyruvyl transferase WcaK-like protein